MPDGSFPIQPRSLAEVEAHDPTGPQPPICALPECDEPAPMGRNGCQRRRYCCDKHAEIGKRQKNRVARTKNRRKRGIMPATYYCIDVDRLRQLAADNLSTTQIAHAMGHECSSIYRCAAKHSIAVRREAPYQRTPGQPDLWKSLDELLIVLLDTALTYSAIAKEMTTLTGEPISKNAVVGRLRRIGMTGVRNSAREARRPLVEFPKYGECIFPSGDLPEMTFCGAEVEDISKPYCSKCYAVAYLPPRPLDKGLAA